MTPVLVLGGIATAYLLALVLMRRMRRRRLVRMLHAEARRRHDAEALRRWSE